MPRTLHAIFRSAGFSGHHDIRQPGAFAGAIGGIDHIAHTLADHADMAGSPVRAIGGLHRLDFPGDAIGGNDLSNQTGFPKRAPIGQSGGIQGQLNRGDEKSPLSNRHVAGVAIAPAVMTGAALPGRVRNEAGTLEIEADLRFAAKAALPRHGLNGLRAAGHGRMVEIDIAGIADGRLQIDASMSPVLPAAEAGRTQLVVPRTGKARLGRHGPALEGGQQGHGLEGASRRVLPARRPVVERTPVILQETVPDGRGNGRDEIIGIIARGAGQGEDIPIPRIDDHHRAAIPVQQLLCRPLNTGIHGQNHIASPAGLTPGDFIELEARHIHLDFQLAAGIGPKNAVQAFFNPGLALHFGQIVVEFLRNLPLCDSPQFGNIGPTHITQKMAALFFQRIHAYRPYGQGHTGKLRLVLHKPRHGLLVQILPGHQRKRGPATEMPADLRRTQFPRAIHHFRKTVKHRHHIVDRPPNRSRSPELLEIQRETIAGTVLRQRHPRAVQNPPTETRQAHTAEALLHKPPLILATLRDLKVPQPDKQHAEKTTHQGPQQQQPPDMDLLGTVPGHQPTSSQVPSRRSSPRIRPNRRGIRTAPRTAEPSMRWKTPLPDRLTRPFRRRRRAMMPVEVAAHKAPKTMTMRALSA